MALATASEEEPCPRIQSGRRGEREEGKSIKGKKIQKGKPLYGRLKRFTPVESLAHRSRVNPFSEEQAIKPSLQRTPVSAPPPMEKSLHGKDSSSSKGKGFHRNLYKKGRSPDKKYHQCWETLQESSSTSHTQSTKPSPPHFLIHRESSTTSSEVDSRIQQSRVKFLRQKFENIDGESDKRSTRKEVTKL